MKRILFTTLICILINGNEIIGQSFSFLHNNILRNYTLYIPSIYDGNTPVPLVFNLHGYSSNAGQQELYSAFDPVADTANFIICYPNGVSNAWNCGGIFTSGVDDIDFISTLIDTISTNYNIDPIRIYSTGMSNGGFMSYQLACQLENRIAAVASVTGSMSLDQIQGCIGGLEIPIMQIHGTADPTVPYNGDTWTVSMDSLINYWRLHNNCSDSLETNNIPDTDPTDGTTTTTYHYKFCDYNTEVLFYKVLNGEHTWPDAPIDIGITSHDFNASGDIWDFFYRHSLHPTATSINENIRLNEKILFYPNPSSQVINFNYPSIPDKLQIYNNTGQLVLNIDNPDKFINIENLKKGIYYIQISINSDLYYSKLIKN